MHNKGLPTLYFPLSPARWKLHEEVSQHSSRPEDAFRNGVCFYGMHAGATMTFNDERLCTDSKRGFPMDYGWLFGLGYDGGSVGKLVLFDRIGHHFEIYKIAFSMFWL